MVVLNTFSITLLFHLSTDQHLEASGAVRPPLYTNPYAFLMTPPPPHLHAGTGFGIVPSAPSSDATPSALCSPNSTIVQFQPQLGMYGNLSHDQPVQSNTQMSMALPIGGCNGTTSTTPMVCKEEALRVSARLHNVQSKHIKFIMQRCLRFLVVNKSGDHCLLVTIV